MPGIGIITNPHSRRNRRYPQQIERLAYVLGEEDYHGLTRSADDVEEVARHFKARDIDILALNGGDGTNHVTLTRFVKVYGDKPLPKIALLRGGTMNTVSNAIGIRGNPAGLLVNIVEKYYLKQPFEISERDLLKVTDDLGTSYGFLFGTGIIANFLEAYYETGHPSPMTGAQVLARLALSTLVRGKLLRRLFERRRLVIEADGEPWLDGTFAAVMASTVDQIGLGFRPFTRCEARPGSFHALVIDTGPFKSVCLLPSVRLGRTLPNEHVPNRVLPHLVIRAERPLPYMVDGDLHPGGLVLTVEAGPRIQLIVK